ncbi:Retrovirus-related Pol polyprotein from transposon RE2 [Vitis vinifera]|uniref:Retrovirus-related Pol polyprotein from transposon RE2 n=1 Tax=Vitis vinifera TaxID=29760 RepID=A0A438HPF4_VITVI|nr:Retrovirus-related Pol polyprotein from transposon RE2 [Vitis vinifera]
MTTPNGTPILPTTNESQLLTINIVAQAPLKLTSSNYLSWKIQFETLFIGYDLLGYIDGSKPCPPKTLTTNNVDTINPAYTLWIRQDQLILNALIDSLSPTIISFIARANTSREAWTILANTYAKPSRARTDELAILGAPMEEEDLTEKILDGLGDELAFHLQPSLPVLLWPPTQELHLAPTALHLVHTRVLPNLWHSSHTAKRCPSFQLVPVQSSTTSATPPANFATPWQPRAHYAANTTTNNPSWLLDSGASHHVTTDLNNLSLHAPYTGSYDVMIGDGTGLLISHTGSASLPSSTTTFTLNDVLYDLHTGAILLTGNTKDGVYEWQLHNLPLLQF